jgi:hypothetical protein
VLGSTARYPVGELCFFDSTMPWVRWHATCERFDWSRKCQLEKGSIMSGRTLISLTASAIISIGCIATISTEASAYFRGGVGVGRAGVYRGGVYRGGVYRGAAVRRGVAVGVGAAAVGAAAVGAAAAGAYYGPGYYGAPAPVACGYGYYFYPPYNRCVPTP